jgi:hypothetical protein
VNRVALMFVLFLAFGWIGVGRTAAQAAPLSTSPPHVAAKTPAAAGPVRPTLSGSNQSTKAPEQTKVVRIYRGEGYFEPSLADRLRPALAKTFGTPQQVVGEASPAKSVPEVLRSILGQGSPEKDGSQPTVAKADQP